MNKQIALLLSFVAVGAYAQFAPVNTGVYPNDGTGDPLRTAYQKINTNFSWISNNFLVWFAERSNTLTHATNNLRQVSNTTDNAVANISVVSNSLDVAEATISGHTGDISAVSNKVDAAVSNLSTVSNAVDAVEAQLPTFIVQENDFGTNLTLVLGTNDSVTLKNDGQMLFSAALVAADGNTRFMSRGDGFQLRYIATPTIGFTSGGITIMDGAPYAPRSTLPGTNDIELVRKLELDTELATKQDTLVSGINIKTVNGSTLLGSGNISISGGGSPDTNIFAERAWVTNSALLTVDAYGADPTGVSDSTDAFNRMLATSHLLMGTGTYLLPNGFTVSNGFSVRGVGSRATYIKTTTATNNGITFANVSGVNGVELKGFTVYNTLGGDTNTGVGIYMRMTNGNYSGAAHRVEDVMAAGFQQGIWAESIPQLRIERSGFVANRIGMHLTKADTALIQGILIAGRANNGIGSVTPLLTSTNYCLAMLVDNGTGIPGGTGFHVKVDTFEIGDVDRVLEINGSTPVVFENGNTERIGAVQAPPGGYSFVFVSNSIAPVTIEGWRTDSVPVGLTNSSSFIHIYADINTGPFVRLSRMQRSFVSLTQNWVPIRVTGPGRAATTFVVDDQVVRIAKHSALGSAPDTGVSTNAFSGPINEVRSGGSFEGSWNSGIVTFRDTGGGATPYLDFFTASATRWRMYATSQSFFIRDVVNGDDQIEITPTTVIMPSATVTNLQARTLTLTAATLTTNAGVTNLNLSINGTTYKIRLD